MSAHVDASLASWSHVGSILAPTWPSWLHLAALLGHLGSNLAKMGSILAPSWPSWLHLGALLGHLGSNLAILARPCLSMLALSWLQLGHLGDLGAPLGHVKLLLGTCWRVLAHLMAMLAPPELQVVQLGPIWMLPWAMLNSFSTHVGASLAISGPCCRHLESICFLLMLDADAA